MIWNMELLAVPHSNLKAFQPKVLQVAWVLLVGNKVDYLCDLFTGS